MAKQTINNGDQLLDVRTKMNENFDELYDDKLTPAEVTEIRAILQHWEVDSNGHLLPKTHLSQDLGKSTQKVRDIYYDN